MGKPHRKAQRKLKTRLEDYEKTVQRSKMGGIEYRRPGSMNPHKQISWEK